MISFQKKFLFIHIPKTGGTSVRQALQPFSEDELLVFQDPKDGKTRFRNRNYHFIKHSPLSEFKSQMKRKDYRSLFKITTIRNPWDKMISFYFSPHRNINEWNRALFIKFVGQAKPAQFYVNIPSLPERINKYFGHSFFPEKKLDADIDCILKFEQLQEDFKKLCTVLDLPYTPLPHVNKSKRVHYADYYDEELYEMVSKKFRREIEFGNYTFEHP